MADFTEIALWLPHQDGALAALLHAPAAPTRSVLFLPPLAEERKGCQRILCETARRFAAAGAAVLRFDYRGSGDSTGVFADFSTADWLADATTALTWLRLRYHLLTPALLGIRLGATLATHLAGPCAARLLVAPLAGADFLRQLLQRNQVNQMVAWGRAQASRAAIEAIWAQGGQADLDGYAITARQAHDLKALELAAWHEPGCVITLGSGDTTATARLATPAAQSVTLRLPAFWNTVGQVEVDALHEALDTALTTHVAAISHPNSVATTPLQDLTPHPEAVAIASAAGTVRGWCDRPAATPRARVLLVHGWSGDRTGPHRMFVTLARALAKLEVLTLRIDLPGRGESDGDTRQTSIAAMTDAAQAALDWLRANEPDGGPLLLAAICSGCKVALTVAATAPDVTALALWSAETMGSLRPSGAARHKTWAALKAYLFKLGRRDTWTKLLRGQIQTSMVTKALVRHETRSAAEAVTEERTLQRLRRYSGRLLFVFGGSDPDAPTAAKAYAAFCRRHGLMYELQTVPHAGHSFYGLAWEREVLALTTDFVIRQLDETLLAGKEAR